MSKVVDPREAIARVKDGASIMMGGFGLCGIPENLIRLLSESGVKDLTVMSNNAGVSDFGVGVLLKNGQVRKLVGTYIGENDLLERMILEKRIEIELNPQGTLAERIRAGGAGIAGFYTPTGVGTVIAEGKETCVLDGREVVLERPLRADFAFIKAFRGDAMGNLVYRRTTRNFNPVMATAADTVFAEVEELVPAGSIDPDAVVTPGIYVDGIFQGAAYEKRIEKRVYR